MWSAKAATEFNRWPRTIFGTFTMSIENHELFDYRLQVGEPGARPPVDFSALNERGIFQARAGIFGDEITKWFDRLKSGHGEPGKRKWRYLLIAEPHDSAATDERLRGRPHWHILLHEKEVGALIHGDPRMAILASDANAITGQPGGEWEKRRYKTRSGWKIGSFASDDAFIRKEWSLGFTKFQLAEDANSAVYVCKYITKAMGVRVRPSNGYGAISS